MFEGSSPERVFDVRIALGDMHALASYIDIVTSSSESTVTIMMRLALNLSCYLSGL